jgi:hypothetical protein
MSRRATMEPSSPVLSRPAQSFSAQTSRLPVRSRKPRRTWMGQCMLPAVWGAAVAARGQAASNLSPRAACAEQSQVYAGNDESQGGYGVWQTRKRDVGRRLAVVGGPVPSTVILDGWRREKWFVVAAVALAEQSQSCDASRSLDATSSRGRGPVAVRGTERSAVASVAWDLGRAGRVRAAPRVQTTDERIGTVRNVGPARRVNRSSSGKPASPAS